MRYTKLLCNLTSYTMTIIASIRSSSTSTEIRNYLVANPNNRRIETWKKTRGQSLGHTLDRVPYLNAGTGNAWAGQSRVKGWPRCTVYVLEFSVIGNLGLVAATGSGWRREQRQGSSSRALPGQGDFPSPVPGDGESLGGAEERERLAQ